jgi:hypothetical protein
MMEKLTAISIPNGYARDEISEISDFALRPLGGPLSSPTGWVFVTGRTHARSVCRGSAGNRCLRRFARMNEGTAIVRSQFLEDSA